MKYQPVEKSVQYLPSVVAQRAEDAVKFLANLQRLFDYLLQVNPSSKKHVELSVVRQYVTGRGSTPLDVIHDCPVEALHKIPPIIKSHDLPFVAWQYPPDNPLY